MRLCRAETKAPGSRRLSWFPGSCIQLAWALVPGTACGPASQGSSFAGITWCPENHPPCPVHLPPSNPEVASAGPIRLSGAETRVVQVWKHSLGHE